jgi:phosphoribosyl 1,2-cyclic phosphodiesterase
MVPDFSPFKPGSTGRAHATSPAGQSQFQLARQAFGAVHSEDIAELLVAEFLTCSIQSGSHGNCIYVEADGVRLLIDAGVTAKCLRDRLEAIGRSPHDIDAVLITHEHSDHTRCLAVFQRKYGFPVYITPATHRVLRERMDEAESCRPQAAGSVGNHGSATGPTAFGTLWAYANETPRVNAIPRELARRRGQQRGGGGVVHFRAGESFTIGAVRIHAAPTPHDAVDGVVFVIEASGKRLGIFTDLGHPFHALGELLSGVDAAYLESNHDPDMLWNGVYPYYLKQRIAGPAGHLANNESADVLNRSATARLNWVALAHLSGENNTPDLALETHRQTVGESLPVTVAPRDCASSLMRV